MALRGMPREISGVEESDSRSFFTKPSSSEASPETFSKNVPSAEGFSPKTVFKNLTRLLPIKRMRMEDPLSA